jgi:hypothetical protein
MIIKRSTRCLFLKKFSPNVYQFYTQFFLEGTSASPPVSNNPVIVDNIISLQDKNDNLLSTYK